MNNNMKKEKKDPKENMELSIKVEIAADGRSPMHFKDYRTTTMKLTRTQATYLMDELEKVVEGAQSTPNTL
jgi:hypothetical protein